MGSDKGKKGQSPVSELFSGGNPYQTFFETAGDAIFIMEDETIIEANPASEKLFNKTRNELLGLSPADLSPPRQPDGSKSREKVHLLLKKVHLGETQFFQWTHIRQGKSEFIAEVRLTLTSFPSGKYIQAIVRDISQRIRAEAELTLLRTHYENLLEYVPVFILGYDYTYLEINEIAAKLVQKTPEEMIGRSVPELFPGIEKTEFYAAYTRGLTTRKEETITEELELPSGKKDWYQVHILPCPEGIQCIAINITATVRNREQLKESEERFRLAIEGSRDGLWDWNLQTNEAYHSEQFARMLGYEPEDLPYTGEAWSGLIHPEDSEKAFAAVEEYLKGNTEQYESVFRMKTKAGTYRWISGRGKALFDEKGAPVRFVGFNTDITHQKETEEQLTFLLKEIHHRTKNNLSMISSLIELKAMSSENPQEFEDIQGQIRAILFVHEKLQHSDDIHAINFGKYIEELLESIFSPSLYSTITVLIDIEPVDLEPGTAIPLGLIVNEIATNTIKYGLNDQGLTDFRVTMEDASGSGVRTLVIGNNGPPLPEDIDLDAPKSLGFRLISALVKQLNGNISVQHHPHPLFRIQFP